MTFYLRSVQLDPRLLKWPFVPRFLSFLCIHSFFCLSLRTDHLFQFLNPVKINEKLVEQLKTQVIDLERFIDFLHGEYNIGKTGILPMNSSYE